MTRLNDDQERDAVSRILPDVFSQSLETSVAAVRALAAIMASLEPDDLPGLEQVVRSAWRSACREPDIVLAVLRDDAGPGADLLGLLSFHPSGYVRESAVRRLAALAGGSELRYLLLRRNDWVSQVREAARDAIRERIRTDSVVAFARSFCLVDRLEVSQRGDRESLIGGLAHIFAATPGVEAILAALASGSRRNRRALIRFAIEHVPAGLSAVIACGVTMADDLIRMWATPLVPQALDGPQALLTLQRLANDPSPAVRREALTALARAFPGERERALERGVLDRSAAVRDICRFLLGRPNADFVRAYRSVISEASSPRLLASAIASLAEVGTASDAGSVAPYLAHSNSSVRRVAVKCVMRLAGDGFAERVASMLIDPSRGVSAAARNSLRNHVRMIGAPRLDEIFAEAARHTRLNIVPLFAALPKWQSIPRLLKVAAGSDKQVADAARRFIRDWNRQYNRSSASPSERELEALAVAFKAAESVLDAGTVREIRFAMSVFK